MAIKSFLTNKKQKKEEQQKQRFGEEQARAREALQQEFLALMQEIKNGNHGEAQRA